MTEREMWMERILNEPESNTHRLVFADWLDENGDSGRAEFIRIQIRQELKPVSERCVGEQKCPDCKREKELLVKHWGEWVPWIAGTIWECPATDEHLSLCVIAHDITGMSLAPAGYTSSRFQVEFKRGFLHTVRCGTADWQRNTPRIGVDEDVRNIPTLGQLILRDNPVERMIFDREVTIAVDHFSSLETNKPWRSARLGAMSRAELYATRDELVADMYDCIRNWLGTDFDWWYHAVGTWGHIPGSWWDRDDPPLQRVDPTRGIIDAR